MNISLSLLLLRLGSKEGNPNNSVLNLIKELKKSKELFASRDYDSATKCVPVIREKAEVVLKAEWISVKKGEKTFRFTKGIALLVLISTILFGGYLIYELQSQSENGEIGNEPPIMKSEQRNNLPYNQKFIPKV